MIIWILALVLFGLFGLVGFSLGAIRLSAALLGLLFGAMLARPLGHLFAPLLHAVGVKNPVLLWLLGPFLAFIVVLIAFKVVGIVVHQQVDVYYKYKAGDVRMGLWNRLNPRLGIAVGLLNAAVYLVLISWVIYVFSYWTNQMVTGDEASWSVRMLNTAGGNLQSTGMAKVAAAIDRMPESYYQAADVVGLIYHNDLLEGRLSRYPGFLALAERPEFQDIANDKDFTELRQKQPPIAEVLNYPKAQAIVNNPDLLRQIWAVAEPNLTDLEGFLKTGQSAKYDDEKILGRWDFDLNGALGYLKRNKPNIPFIEMQRSKQVMTLIFARTTFLASPEPEKLAILKDFGKLVPGATPKQPPTVTLQNYSGQWSSDGGKYDLSLPEKSQNSLEAVVDGDRLTITGDTYPLVFEKEY